MIDFDLFPKIIIKWDITTINNTLMNVSIKMYFFCLIINWPPPLKTLRQFLLLSVCYLPSLFCFVVLSLFRFGQLHGSVFWYCSILSRLLIWSLFSLYWFGYDVVSFFHSLCFWFVLFREWEFPIGLVQKKKIPIGYYRGDLWVSNELVNLVFD